MSPPRVVFAPHLLQTLDSRKQPLRCTNLVRENVRASRTPGEPPPPGTRRPNTPTGLPHPPHRQGMTAPCATASRRPLSSRCARAWDLAVFCVSAAPIPPVADLPRG